MRKHCLFLLFISLSIFTFATTYYVSPTGSNSNAGTLAKPFQTITFAYTKVVAGDIIYLRAGTYREAVALVSKSGTYNKPITLTAYNGENAILSGLDVKSLTWTASTNPNIWVASYTGTSFEQMFCDGKPMLEARWPNVPKDANGDWNFFSPDVWAAVDATGNSYGTVSDMHLALTGWNITGVRAVLNVSHQYYCWTRTVSSHTASTSTFTYPADLGGSVSVTDNYNDDRYYLVGQKVFLDSPGEWYNDTINHQLYYYPINAKNPNTSTLEIKTRNYGFKADLNSDYLTIDGITFFGTAFSFGKSYPSRSNGITFKNNQVLYSSWTDNLNLSSTDPNYSLNLDKNYSFIQADTVKVINNTFAYGALEAVLVNGYGNLIENNVLHDFDISSSLVYPVMEVSRNWAAYVGCGGNVTVRYNTFYNSGGIHLEIGQGGNDVSLNKCYNAFRACWGGNKDHSAIYTNSIYCDGTRIHHNWIYDSFAGTPPLPWGGGMAIRGDDSSVGLTIDHNVGWNIGSTGIELKNVASPTAAQANKVYNNTFFQHSRNNTIKSAMIIRTALTNENMYSSVVNNMAQTIYGDWNAAVLGTVATKSNNSTGTVPDALMQDTTNYDFRPKTTATAVYNKGAVVAGFTTSVFGSAPDIGAYERGDSIYWIPGQRVAKASFPIVPNAMVSVPLTRDVLMWLQGYNAVAHQVYFGTNIVAVSNATTSSAEYKGILKGNRNVYTLPALSSGISYFWRIDAVLADNTVTKGNVWSFSTGSSIVTNIQDTTDLNQLSVFPNPATDMLNIYSAGSNLRQVEIYDLSGSMIKKMDVSSDKLQIPVSDLKSGMYIVKIVTEKNNCVKQFVKR
ncbi:MAG: T9SS type A sorting domain-containing protein [Paludibacter sp.]